MENTADETQHEDDVGGSLLRDERLERFGMC